VIPNDFPGSELFPGGSIQGNVCWQIKSQDAGSLVMYSGLSRVWRLAPIRSSPREPSKEATVPLQGTGPCISWVSLARSVQLKQ
jgi:hypothetical protein